MLRVACIASLLTAAVVATTWAAEAMSVYRWSYRPLIVFAPTDADARLAAQRGIVTRNRAGFIARNMAVVYVVGNRVSTALGPPPGLSAVALRQRFGVTKAAFRTFLVGKDGGVKRASASPLTTNQLYPLIDAMPMRREELRRRGR